MKTWQEEMVDPKWNVNKPSATEWRRRVQDYSNLYREMRKLKDMYPKALNDAFKTEQKLAGVTEAVRALVKLVLDKDKDIDFLKETLELVREDNS